MRVFPVSPGKKEEPSDWLIIPSESETGAGTDLLDALMRHFSNGETQVSDLDPNLVRDLRTELKRSRFFGEDMKFLWIMLERAMTRSGRSPGRDGELRLLNLACGPCEEGAVLSAFFGRAGRKVRQFAMDLREREIGKARRRYAGTERLFRKAGIPGIREENASKKVEFVAEDATRLAGYGQIPDEFDVVFIRHQNLWHDGDVWCKIYGFSLERLEPENGVLVITSYFDREHILALDLLKTMGGRVLFTGQNPNSRKLDYPGKTVDRHVAVIAQGI